MLELANGRKIKGGILPDDGRFHEQICGHPNFKTAS
jgi:hypothetical protein